MSRDSDNSNSSDIRLMLHCHCEQLWLSTQVVPIMRQLEQRGAIPEDQLGAALAYLEVLWIDASRRAAATDSAFAEVASANGYDGVLRADARRYHAAVCTLRELLAAHVSRLTAPRVPPRVCAHEHAAL